MDTNFEIDRDSRPRRVSSSENHVVPATDQAALLAYTELYTLRTARRDLLSAIDSEADFTAAVGALHERYAKGLAAISRVKNPRVRDFLSDMDTLRMMPADVFTAPVGAWTAGVTVALAAVLADIALVAATHPAGLGARRAVVAMIDRDAGDARRRWHTHQAEIVRRHPEITDPNPAFTLVMTDPDAPYYLVPVTI